jgi:hypothetical protein
MPINQLFQDTQLQYFKEQKNNQYKILTYYAMLVKIILLKIP